MTYRSRISALPIVERLRAVFRLEYLIGSFLRVSSHPCDAGAGHAWKECGARVCPGHAGGSALDAHAQSAPAAAPCQQPIFRCQECGTYDYGEPGGPGHAHCESKGCRGAEVPPSIDF